METFMDAKPIDVQPRSERVVPDAFSSTLAAKKFASISRKWEVVENELVFVGGRPISRSIKMLAVSDSSQPSTSSNFRSSAMISDHEKTRGS